MGIPKVLGQLSMAGGISPALLHIHYLRWQIGVKCRTSSLVHMTAKGLKAIKQPPAMVACRLARHTVPGQVEG